MKRREFVRICAAAAGAAPFAAAPQGSTLSARTYARVKLVDEHGDPVRVGKLVVGKNYVFDYPFASTPCFLLRLHAPAKDTAELRTESGFTYQWKGGVGPKRDVVAYSAICAHKMTYPTKQVSFIGYRDEATPLAKERVIACCSDRSIYDPAAGARVISGPAPQPLATILLEHDPKADELHALGTFGGEMFHEFFKKYDFRLQMEMGPRARASVDATSAVRPIERYSTQWAKC